jgi:plasmid maintenance system antidote protein VapI
MDSLRLGLQAVFLMDTPAARRYQRRQERLKAKEWQQATLSRMAEKSVTSQDVARVIGVNTETVSRVLSGRMQLPKSWFSPLSKMLGLTVQELTETWRPWPKLRPSYTRLTEQDTHARQVLIDLTAQRRFRKIDLAKAIGIRQSLISRALSGRVRIPEGWYPKIASFFGTSPDIFESQSRMART